MISTYYSDTYPLPLPAQHRFPLSKYRRLRKRVESGPLASQFDLQLAPTASDEQLLRVHTRDYLQRLSAGQLTALEQRRIGFPWSAEMVRRCRGSTGGTLAAAKAAMQTGAGVHLAGGTHHAFADRGQGFCVFNDVAVAICDLRAAGLIHRAVVIDLDVHQGNGTARLFAEDPQTFTFSMHGAENYPFEKCDGDLDIPLARNSGDQAYLPALQTALHQQLPLPQADVVFYLAGADPWEGDKYGTLRLTKAGLLARDQLVVAACGQVPMVVVMAGGYGPIEETIAIHQQTLAALAAHHRAHSD